MSVISVRGIGGSGYLYLSKGANFNVDITFDYKGKPQNLTYELMMKQGILGTEYLSGKPIASVSGASDWVTIPTTMSYRVPNEVKSGSQDIRLHIVSEDGKEEYSGWLADRIWVS